MKKLILFLAIILPLFISAQNQSTTVPKSISSSVHSGTNITVTKNATSTSYTVSSGGTTVVGSVVGGSGITTTGTSTITVSLSPITISTYSLSTYTLTLTDANTMLDTQYGTANTINIPTNATAAFSIGTQIMITQIGAGQITFAPAAGVTMNSASSLTHTASQYAGAVLIKIATNTWLLIGNIS